MREDQDLAGRFAELRAGDRRGVPSFDDLVRRPRRPSFLAPLLAAAAVAVTIVVLALLPRLRGNKSAGVGIAEWQSPTASLLAVPGSDLLRTVPSISESVIHTEDQ